MSTTLESRSGHPPTGVAVRLLIRRVHRLSGLVVGLVTAAVAWILPVLGVTLAGFLVLDLVLSKIGRMIPPSRHSRRA